MKINLNEVERDTFDVIPDGETVCVVMRLHAGDDGLGSLMKSKNSAAHYLKAELTVTEGKYAKRKFFQNFTLATDDDDNEGHAKAIKISKQLLRSIVEAVKHISATDESPAAIKARNVDLATLDGCEFMCVVGVSKGRDGFADQNQIKRVVNMANVTSDASAKPAAKAAADKSW